MSRLDSAPRTTTTSPTPRCQHYTITIDTTLSTSSEANLLTSSWRKRPLLPRLHLHSWTPRHPLTTNSTSTSLALLKPPRFPYFCFAPSRKSGRCRSLVFFSIGSHILGPIGFKRCLNYTFCLPFSRRTVILLVSFLSQNLSTILAYSF